MNASAATTSMVSAVSAQKQLSMSSLPSGIPMAKPLKLDDITINWKKFKRVWDNYVMVVRLQQFDEEYKTAMFLSAFSKEELEIYVGMIFDPPTSLKLLDSADQKLEELRIGQTNKTFEWYVFNSRSQKEGESIDHHVSSLRALVKCCNFGECFIQDSLLRHRIVFGLTEPALRKKLYCKKDASPLKRRSTFAKAGRRLLSI